MTPLSLSGLFTSFSSFIETALLWIVWGIACAWMLSRIYSRHTSLLVVQLRNTAILLDIALIFLLFLPWFPRTAGYANALNLTFTGNGDIARYIAMLILSLLLFTATRSVGLWKLAILLHLVNSMLIVSILITPQPETIVLTIHDIAPFTSALLLWLGNMVVLLLWNRLRKLEDTLQTIL